eukprot:1180468-Prorocentrum_minimum.AAC.1
MGRCCCSTEHRVNERRWVGVVALQNTGSGFRNERRWVGVVALQNTGSGFVGLREAHLLVRKREVVTHSPSNLVQVALSCSGEQDLYRALDALRAEAAVHHPTHHFTNYLRPWTRER